MTRRVVGPLPIRMYVPTFCQRGIQSLGNAFTAWFSIRPNPRCCINRIIVASTKARMQEMIGRIFNRTCLQNLAFLSHWIAPILIQCMSWWKIQQPGTTLGNSSQYIEQKTEGKSGSHLQRGCRKDQAYY